MLEKVNEKYEEYLKKMELVSISASIRIALAISSLANNYFQCGKPWKLINSSDSKEKARCDTIINSCFQAIHLLAGILCPFIPAASSKIEETANFKVNFVLIANFTHFNNNSLLLEIRSVTKRI